MTNDGFKVLRQKNKKDTVSALKVKSRIGAYPLIKPKSVADSLSYSPERASVPFNFKNLSHSKTKYTVDFKSKTWQNKAWRLISTDLDINRTPAFKKSKHLSDKIRHLVRIGIALKVRADGSGSSKPVIDQIAPENNPYGIYAVADDEEDIKDLFNLVYRMVYVNIDEYVKILERLGFDGGTYIMKCIAVYDDKSFDALTGDVRYLFEFFGLKYDKNGRVKL